jgi:hypothetical protein
LRNNTLTAAASSGAWCSKNNRYQKGGKCTSLMALINDL